MEIDKVFSGDVDGVADNLFSAVKNSVSEIKAMQQRKAAENVQLVIQALKKIESDLQDKFDGVTTVIEKRVSTIKDGRDGVNGRDGRDGKDGRPGKDGLPGRPGKDGMPGRDGMDGQDGVSVTDARIDFDGSLIIGLSSGREINVGEVVAPDLAERIKVITNGGGTSQSVLDTLASLQAQINALDGFLDYKGTWNASTNTPTLVSSTGTKGDYYVVSVAGSTSLDGETKWGVGDWVVFNNSTWQKVDGGSTGNFTNITASGDLTIAGDIFTNAASGVFFNGQSSFTTGIFSTPDGLEMRFYAADATDKMRLNGTGLGIGNTNPTEKLDVTGNFKLSGSATLSGGTANGVAYLNGSKVVTTGSALTFDGTGLSVTGSTSATLKLNGRSSDNASSANFYDNTGATRYGFIYFDPSNAQIATTNANPLAFLINSSEQMRLTSTGLGIGTSSPSQKLHVVGNGVFTDNVGIGTTSPSYKLQLNTASAADIETGVSNSAGLSRFGTRGSGNSFVGAFTAGKSLELWSAGTLNATLDSSGNLGIGTSSPGYKLDVNGIINNTSAIYWANGVGKLQFSGSDAYIDSTGAMIFRSGGSTERARIDSSGNLLVGTTTNDYTATNGFVVNGPSSGTYAAVCHASGTGSGASYVIFSYNGGLIGNITQNGTTAVAYNTTSDARLKENIADSDDASALIDAIQVRKYDWKSDGSHQRYGFVAQELLTVAPEAVHQPADSDEMMGVDYSKLVPMLVKEIQSLRKRVAQLEGA